MTIDMFLSARLPALTRTALALTGDSGLAEDLVQEVLIKAHRRWDHISGLDAPEAYLRRMLVNEFISWRRKWGRIVPVAEVRTNAVAPDHAHEIAVRSVLAEQLTRLPRRQQAALALRYFEGLEVDGIAEILSCRPGTVRSLLSRALASLRIDETLRAEFLVELVVSDEGRTS